MNDQKYLYILFSATPYRLGRWIRLATGEPYNHVAIATEEDLREYYGFARRYYQTPFYGGFVTERPSRYRHEDRISSIRLYRLPLTQSQWTQVESLLDHMRSCPERYLYNHLSAMMAPIHIKIRVKDAFTCVEFVVMVLSRLGFDFDAARFYTIGGIAERLERYCVYTGSFPAPAEEEHSFFQDCPVRHPLYASARSIFQLLWRKALA